MEIKSFGTMRSGEKIDSITLKNAAGTELELLNIGAVIRSLKVRDREGNLRDVVLGYDSVDRYEKNYAFFGATVGRYANRIAGGTFELNGKTYSVPVWRGKGVSLHCLPDTYSFRFWNYEAVREQDGECVTFYLDSPDGDQGLPGNLFFAVTYHLTDDNEVILEYYAESDADTLLNPTNHTYFNLSGHASGNVLNHTLKILSDEIPVYDDAICPIGSFEKIGGTAYDFQTEKTIGQDVRAKVRGITENYGYDVAYVVNGGKK
ncbi:MAG: galactose mutarotase, partial [Lachnospiraceae bacterium]|nr:galactose mutarotase [Lachnospiraceae bacterium]